MKVDDERLIELIGRVIDGIAERVAVSTNNLLKWCLAFIISGFAGIAFIAYTVGVDRNEIKRDIQSLQEKQIAHEKVPFHYGADKFIDNKELQLAILLTLQEWRKMQKDPNYIPEIKSIK